MKDSIRPWILGIGASAHNGAVCLLRGDEIVVAIQEERLLRVKRAAQAAGVPSLAIAYCLDHAGIVPSDLSAVGVCSIRDNVARDDVFLNRQLRVVAHDIDVVRVTHHVGHAAGAFATSGFESAAVLVIDGYGSPWKCLPSDENDVVLEAHRRRYRPEDALAVEVLSMYSAGPDGIRPLEKHLGRRGEDDATRGMPPFFSIGLLFDSVGMQIFGEPLDGAGKVMGLAPYGKPLLPPEMFFDCSGDEIVFRDAVPGMFTGTERWPDRQEDYANLAASVQMALERALIWCVDRLRAKTASTRLCYAGGVALNSVANERIIRESGFDEVFIMPAAEDSGTAIGAAYCALWKLSARTRTRKYIQDSVGKSYSSQDVDAAIANQSGVRRMVVPDPLTEVARLLSEGQIVGWFDGGSELGPRALGQRSILTDPRRADMKDVLNSRVKFRESFRPYAPAILREHVAEWFETDSHSGDSPFMLRVMKFRESHRDRVPAVVHVDGTGRVQTVTAAANPRLHALLAAFHHVTGVPILLNTSFNVSGEPIVETPDDALWSMLFSGLDACVLGDRLVVRADTWSPLDWTPCLSIRSMSHAFAVRGVRTDWRLRSSASGFLHSSAEGSADTLIEWAERHAGDYVRFDVEGKWGRVVHVGGAELAVILRFIDGARTGRQILEQLQERGIRSNEAALVKLLARLARQGAIGFRSPIVEPTMDAPMVDERRSVAEAQP
jgi:carbamoyltransferase